MRIECWTTKATDTHSEFVIPNSFSLQQWLHERPLVQLYPDSLCPLPPRILRTILSSLGFVCPCIFTHSNESTNQMQQLITGLLFVVCIPLNMFRASLCPSSGAYQLQQQPLVYRRNVVVAVLLADHGQQHCYYHVPTVNQRRLVLQLIGS